MVIPRFFISMYLFITSLGLGFFLFGPRINFTCIRSGPRQSMWLLEQCFSSINTNLFCKYLYCQFYI